MADSAVFVELRLVGDAEHPRGTATCAGQTTAFDGWLGLAELLSRVLGADEQ